jgi:pheromone shutdown-related protein TraB
MNNGLPYPLDLKENWLALNDTSEPIAELRVGSADLTLLGTAHVSRASAQKVEELLREGGYDTVAIELCESRHQAITDPDSLARMDLFKVIRERKVPMVTASLALGAFQQRLAEQFDMEPGAEMRAAIRVAEQAGIRVLLIDREIGVTLRRVYRNVPWWRRMYIVSGLLTSMFSREEFSEEDIERLKTRDILEATFAEFEDTAGDLFEPLIAERDLYMALKLQNGIRETGASKVLAVVGAGHLKGITARLGETPSDPDAMIDTLNHVPPPSRWPRRFAWAVVALVILGFTIGFSRSPELGWQLVADWVLINGGLSALGALIAGGHVLTVLTAFCAAPLTSLNPTIGAGMATAAVEIYIRKPTVGDFAALRSDTQSFAGWRANRVARTLLVFLLSTLGSAIGTYVAGFRIFERLI